MGDFVIKKTILIIFVLFFIMLNSIFAIDISDCTQLQGITTGNNYTLINDIDCSDTINWNGGQGFLPITTFENVFEGNGYTISNLFINRSATDNVGLFSLSSTYMTVQNITFTNPTIIGNNDVGVIGGDIKGYFYNIKIENGKLFGNNNVGGLVGQMSYNIQPMIIDNVVFIGNINSSGAYVGGLIGRANFGSTAQVKKSYVKANLFSTVGVGGLIGYAINYPNPSASYRLYLYENFVEGNFSSTGNIVGGMIGYALAGTLNGGTRLYDSYSNAVLKGNDYVGGLIGYFKIPSSSNWENYIRKSYIKNKVEGNGTYVGAIAGYKTGSVFDITISDVFWNNQTTNLSCVGVGTADITNCEGKSSYDLKLNSTFTNFDFSTIWDINETKTNPFLRSIPLEYQFIPPPPPIPKKEQPFFLYYNDFSDGNESLDGWVTNGWYVNAEGKAQGYNTWALYYPDFIETFYPELNNASTTSTIFLSVDKNILNGLKHGCMGFYSDASVTLYNSREIQCHRTFDTNYIFTTRASSGVYSSYNGYAIPFNVENRYGFALTKSTTIDTHRIFLNESQKTNNGFSHYNLEYGDLGFYRVDSFTSASLMTLDNIMVWEGLTMPEILYVTPIPEITVFSPVNNTLYNDSVLNVSFKVVDDDNLTLSCRIELNESIIWFNQTNNNTITNLYFNLTNNNYNINFFCDDDNYNNESSGEYYFEINDIPECQENWQPYYYGCQINDEQQKYYIDNNNCSTTNDLPIDNGSYVACNYCSASLSYILGDCSWNGSDFYTSAYYEDDNYYSCCSVTGLYSDCIIDYDPYNLTYLEPCNYYANDFEIEYDEQALYGLSNRDKVFWKFYINKTNTTEDYDCISYVKHMNNGVVGEIIQVNPTYMKKNEAFFSINDEFDDREYFKTVNGLGNVYFTKENIVFDVRQYLFGIQCSGNNERLISERVVTTEYEALNKPINLSVWVKNNLGAIILGVLFLIIITIFIGLYIDSFQRG